MEIPKGLLPILEWNKTWFYKQQKEFIKALKDHWEVVFCAGNGCGKTLLLYWNGICYALGIHPYQIAPPPLNIKVLMNDFEHGYHRIFVETCLHEQYMPDGTVIPPLIPQEIIKSHPSRDNRTLEFLNLMDSRKQGSILFFQTSEQKKRLHSGTNFDILLCDEEAEKQTYDESKRGLRTAKGGGRILHAFTPPFDDESKNKGPTWTKFDLIDPFEKGEDPDVYVARAAMKDNPAITEDFIRKFSKGKTEEQLRIQLYGDYPTWGKLIFKYFEDFEWDPVTKKGNILPWDFEVPWHDPDVQFEMAVDWHGSKPCAVIWSFEYKAGPNKGDVIVFDELSPQAGKDLTISGVVQTCRQIENFSSRAIKRYCDPKMRDKNNALVTGFNAWEEFRHCGMPLTESWKRDPYVGYSIINDFLRGKTSSNIDHPRLFIKENCKSLRHNMKNHYNVQKTGSIAVPDSKFSDYCVNLKYIMLPKSRKVKKNMEKIGRYSKFPITSIEAVRRNNMFNRYNDYRRIA